jgi:hypothetical protein
MMNYPKILEGLGISSESIQKIKLGRGIAGKLTNITIVVILVLGGISLKLNNWILLAIAFLIITIVAIYCFNKILKISKDKPDIAILEGAEFLVYHKMKLGAKGISEIPRLENPQLEPGSPDLPPLPESEPPEKEVEE